MKMTKQTLAEITKDFITVKNSKICCDKFILASNFLNNKAPIAHALWRVVYEQKKYDDTHPAYAEHGRPRVLPFVSCSFEIYPDGTNDKTLSTALIKAFEDAFKSEIEYVKSINNNL